MIKKILYSLLLIGLLSSCTSYLGVANLGSKMKKLELGMTKQEVTSILGNTYGVIAASQTPDGKLEICRFEGLNTYSYSVYFLDNKLVEWHEGGPRHENADKIIIRESNQQ